MFSMTLPFGLCVCACALLANPWQYGWMLKLIFGMVKTYVDLWKDLLRCWHIQCCWHKTDMLSICPAFIVFFWWFIFFITKQYCFKSWIFFIYPIFTWLKGIYPVEIGHAKPTLNKISKYTSKNYTFMLWMRLFLVIDWFRGLVEVNLTFLFRNSLRSIKLSSSCNSSITLTRLYGVLYLIISWFWKHGINATILANAHTFWLMRIFAIHK